MSVCLWPIDALPVLYNYGHAAPFYQISRGVRAIVFGTKNDRESISPLRMDHAHLISGNEFRDSERVDSCFLYIIAVDTVVPTERNSRCEELGGVERGNK